ncbi:unnamed protein product [Trichobilharzia regenti]|nr:unnamed protein product [Trichobilharzia regenti]
MSFAYSKSIRLFPGNNWIRKSSSSVKDTSISIFMMKLNRNGESGHPCRTPLVVINSDDNSP